MQTREDSLDLWAGGLFAPMHGHTDCESAARLVAFPLGRGINSGRRASQDRLTALGVEPEPAPRLPDLISSAISNPAHGTPLVREVLGGFSSLEQHEVVIGHTEDFGSANLAVNETGHESSLAPSSDPSGLRRLRTSRVPVGTFLQRLTAVSGRFWKGPADTQNPADSGGFWLYY